MDIGKVVKGLNEAQPYWGLFTSIIVGGLGYAIGRVQTAYKSRNNFDSQTSFSDNLPKETNDEEEGYQKRTIDRAMLPDKESRISGTIVEFHTSFNGYSGIISDDFKQAPFYFDRDYIDSTEQEGLVPILLQDSLKNGTSVEMDVEFDEDSKVLTVNRMKHSMNNQDYEV